MSVAELMTALATLPPDRPVFIEWDGALHEIEAVQATTPIAARIASGRLAQTDTAIVLLRH